jgi:hypothetical protein
VSPVSSPGPEPHPAHIQRCIVDHEEKIRAEIAFIELLDTNERGSASIHERGRLDQDYRSVPDRSARPKASAVPLEGVEAPVVREPVHDPPTDIMASVVVAGPRVSEPDHHLHVSIPWKRSVVRIFLGF